jgi:diguanylate cyclase (GGDEF)-like protein/PAS domain S-box-containing protein
MTEKTDKQEKKILLEEIEKKTKHIKNLRTRKKHYKDAFKHSKTTINALMNATSDLALIIDISGIILEISESACVRVGKNPDQLIGKCLFDYFEPEVVEFRKAYVNMVTQSLQPISYEDYFQDMTLMVRIHPIINLHNEAHKLAVFISDHTEQKKNETLLNQYSQILSTINDPIAYIDRNFIYQTVNEAYLKIYHKSKRKVIGQKVEKIIGKEIFAEKIKPFIAKCLKGEKIYNQDWFDFPDNQRRFMYMSFYPLYAKEEKISGVVINSIDITKIKEMEEKLKLLSETDPLTQIYNRVKFDDSLSREIIRLRRYPMELSLIMFDIDHFKKVNDTFGHDVGDDVLKSLAGFIKKFIRETDIFARWGGEEFMILLPHTSLKSAAKLGERIRAHLEHFPFEKIGQLTCSFGVTEFTDKDTMDTFTKRVDKALYKAKQKGRNKVIAAHAFDKQ